MLKGLSSAQISNTHVWLVTRGAQACGDVNRPVAFWQTPVCRAWGAHSLASIPIGGEA